MERGKEEDGGRRETQTETQRRKSEFVHQKVTDAWWKKLFVQLIYSTI